MGGYGSENRASVQDRPHHTDGQRLLVAEAQGTGERETDGGAGKGCPTGPCDTIEGFGFNPKDNRKQLPFFCFCFFKFYFKRGRERESERA